MFGIVKKGKIFMLYDDKKFIGKVIKNARKRVKMTQADLAEKINMSEKNLVNIETGKQFPKVNNFLRIIDLLEISIDEFGLKQTCDKEDTNKEYLLKQILLATSDEVTNYAKLLKIAKQI